MPQPTVRSAEADAIVLTALENGHAVRVACGMARYARRSVYRWRGEDPDFAARWGMATEMAGDLLEEEADRRGRDGYDIPVFHKGKACGSKKVYADSLLLARLKALRPELYRERRGPAAPAPLQPVTVNVRDFTLENLFRRAMQGEIIDRTAIPPRIQSLIDQPDNETGQ